MISRNLFFVSLVLSACSSEDGLQAKPPDAVVPNPLIEVTPQSLVYGALAGGQTETQVFSVKNVGDALLTISDLEVEAGQFAFSVDGSSNFTLEVDEARDVVVVFTPAGSDENFGRINVLSDDALNPSVPVDLLGYGTVPDLKITPDDFDFGDSFVPCGSSKVLTLENIGSEDLIITDLSYESLGLLSLESNLNLDPNSGATITLAPGAPPLEVTVHFDPATTGADAGELLVWSNDPIGVESATQRGEGTHYMEESEDFAEPDLPSVDIIMLADQSGSMSSNQDQVENGIPDFFDQLSVLSDWQFSLVVNADGCLTNDILTPNVPNPGPSVSNEVFQGTGNNVDTVTEKLLSLAQTALAKSDPGECNDGMIRNGALLHLIMLSDENEQSSQNWQVYVDSFIAAKGDPNLVKISVVADLTSNSSCGFYSVGDSDSGPGGYLDAANYTGGLTLDICDPNWGAQMTDLATEIVAGVRSYNLTLPADGQAIEVLVNNIPATEWVYNEGGNSITVIEPPVGEGDIVSIEYGVLSECQ